jgi:hypothetical protein
MLNIDPTHVASSVLGTLFHKSLDGVKSTALVVRLCGYTIRLTPEVIRTQLGSALRRKTLNPRTKVPILHRQHPHLKVKVHYQMVHYPGSRLAMIEKESHHCEYVPEGK